MAIIEELILEKVDAVFTVASMEEIENREGERALVGIYLDRMYSHEKFACVFGAKAGFDSDVKDAFHLLIPVNGNRFGYETYISPDDYGLKLSGKLIDQIEVRFTELPCVLFRSRGKQYFYLKLGGLTDEEIRNEIGLIGEIAKECQANGPKDPQEFRKWVNMHVANHLNRRRALSAGRKAIPALAWLMEIIIGKIKLT